MLPASRRLASAMKKSAARVCAARRRSLRLSPVGAAISACSMRVVADDVGDVVDLVITRPPWPGGDRATC